jgi:hypothetical protein
VIVNASASGDSGTATCPGANPNVVGGGFGGLDVRDAKQSYPSASNAWTVTLDGSDSSWNVYAVCAA